MYQDPKITKAEYYNDYKLKVFFSDGTTNVFDFKSLVISDRKEYKPYIDVTKFKKFRVQKKANSIAWGKEVDMQIPGFILYSEKRPSIGWTKFETPEEVKKRLPKKHHYEMFVDNNIWSGILVISELLSSDRNTDLFLQKFNKGVKVEYCFKVYMKNKFLLQIQLQPFGLIYNLNVKNIGSLFYKINFEKNIIGKDLKGVTLKKYENLSMQIFTMLKSERKSVRTSFGTLK